GKLLGINTAVLDETGASIGIGFAIPADSAMKSLDSIMKHGRVVRGSLGLGGQVLSLPKDFIDRWQLTTSAALLVEDIELNGPAHQAGLRRGDLITHLNEQPLNSNRQALNLISDTAPGSQMKIKVVREGRQIELTAILGTREPLRTRT